MVLSLRRLVLAVAILLAGIGLSVLWRRLGWLSEATSMAWIAPGGLALAAALLVALRQPAPEPQIEAERIELLPRERLAELVRGTSLQLRDMRYRYSVRPDLGARAPFSAKVNQIRLGFVPVVITDNSNDRQGLGFVAFVFDGQRFRGPGLPCAGSRDEALTHAAKCVEPLAEIEDSAG